MTIKSDSTMRCSKSIRYAVEPVLLFYAFGLFLNQPILTQFIYKKISKEKGFPYEYSGDKSGCKKETNNATLQALQKEVQGMASYFLIMFTFCSSVPSMFVCLFVGAWSDRVGRKPVLILSLIGSLLECVAILLTVYLDLPLWFILVGSFFNGLGGYFTSVIMSVLSYVSDTTAVNERTVRLGLIEAIVFFGGTFSNFVSGYLITAFDFQNAFWFVLSFLCASLLYTVVILPESLPKAKRVSGKSFSLTFPKKVWETLVRPRPQKWKLKVFIMADGFVGIMNMGLAGVFQLYLLNYPFCWTSIRVGYIIGIRLFIMGCGAFFTLKLFKRWGLPDYVTILLGLSSNVAFYSVMAVSKVNWHLYVACAACIFVGVTAPTFKGLLSKSVGQDEQGTLFSAVASVEMLCNFLGSLTFNAFYAFVNRRDTPGLVYVLTIFVAYVPVILTLIYKIKMKQEYLPPVKNIVSCISDDEDKELKDPHLGENEPLIVS